MPSVLLTSSPNGPKQYSEPKAIGCTITVECLNSENILETIVVTCPGQKQCRDWVEPWIDKYESSEYVDGCLIITYPTFEFNKTGTECGECKGYANSQCNCPPGYFKVSSTSS